VVAWVVDTNVISVANGLAGQAGLECVRTCVAALQRARDEGICIDDGSELLSEYMKARTDRGEVGDLFLRWILDNRGNPESCQLVPITPSGDQWIWNEFPHDPELADFDEDDRKFVAVVRASSDDPTVPPGQLFHHSIGLLGG